MTFQIAWTGVRKKEEPNKLRKNPTISVRLNLYPTTQAYVNSRKNKSEFILQAIETRVCIETNKRLFLRQMLEENYNLCRHLLRKIGGRKKFQ